MMAENTGSDEKPLPLKRSHTLKNDSNKTTGLLCIIHYSQNKSDTKIRPLSETSFEKIQETIECRRSQERVNERQGAICSQVPVNYCPNLHGYHRWCYNNFTNISRLRKRKILSGNDNESGHPKKRRTSEVSSSRILFPADKCLFCDKNRIRKRGTEEILVKCCTTTASDSIKTAASRKQDHILAKVLNRDLAAREAHYHASCRKEYTRVGDRNENSVKDINTVQEQNAHSEAFEYITEYVQESIIDGANVERMTMLRERYLQFIYENSPQYHNVDYKTYKLKSKLINHFGNKIQFWQPNYKSDLVFSSEIPKGQAVESAFEVAASEAKRIEEAALLIRRAIKNAQSESQQIPWPPTHSFLHSTAVRPPECLQDFIANVITGKKGHDSAKTQRLALSFSEDICQAATRGQWTMPKHLLLAMALRNLTGSAEILTLINRYGHCASYSRALELETAMCKSIDEKASVIPPTINPDKNIVTHLCWDNFDLREETPSGAGTTHTSHGIIIQEVLPTIEGPLTETRVSRPRTKERSVVRRHTELEPCFLKDKAEPEIVLSKTDAADTQSDARAFSHDMLWIYSRALSHDATQKVPPWAGWISLTEGNTADINQQSTVDYLAPVFSPITENSTVQAILQLSQEATREVGQQYTIVTFDLAVAKKAYALVWQNQLDFSNIVVRMGAFHLTCAYMCALGKSLRGSGFEEILVESGVCASGSIDKVMSGKHYNRALRVHKLILEALERLLLQLFESSRAVTLDEEGQGKMKRLSQNPSTETLSEVLANESCMNLLTLYSEFKHNARRGEMGKTAQFWLMYMDRVWLVLHFQRATKENNLDLHMSCLQSMCSLFFCYDHPNYARYTTVYLLTLLNLPESHPGAEELLRHNGFSVNRSAVPSSRNAVDITIEQTINRHAKSCGGIVGFSRNHSAYYRWCMTRHARASYQQAAMARVDMDSQECTTHKDLRPSQITRSEEDTCKVTRAIENFINPFEVDNKDALYCLSSGAPVPKDVERDLLQGEKIGQEAHSTFVKERLIEKTKSFNAPIKRLNLKTFAKLAKSATVTGKSKKSKQIIAERNVFGQLVLLALEHDISLERALSFPLGPVPWSLATADGAPTKTDKSKLMHFLEKNVNTAEAPTTLTSTSYIIDGNALLHAQMSLPTTFGELAENIFRQLPKVQRVDFVTDSYHYMSIKGIERERRGASEAHIIKGALTKVPRDWKTFLSNDENKKRLTKFLLDEWKSDKYANNLKDRNVLFVCGRNCVSLSSSDGRTTTAEDIEALRSSQEEADTRIVLHCLHIASHSTHETTIIVRSPDTDVFILLLTFTQELQQNILFDTGVGNKRRLIDVQSVIRDVGKDICMALPAIHAFTGCDTTSAFVRKGKLMPLKIVLNQPDFLPVFLTLGRSIDVDEQTYRKLENFTCLLYKGVVTDDINKLRHEKYLERFSVKSGGVLSSYTGVDMSLLPPCHRSLRMHIKRANYQALIWYQADHPNPNIPQPEEHGWRIASGQLEINWTDGDLMPQDLVDLLPEDDQGSNDHQEEDQEEDQEENDPPELHNWTDIIFESDD